jgi:cyclin-dependent kinase
LRRGSTAKQHPRCSVQRKTVMIKLIGCMKVEYDAACAKEIETLEQQSCFVDTELDELAGAGVNPNAPDLGPYKNATFHKDGVFSKIFKAAASGPVDNRSRQQSDLVALKVTTPSAMRAPHNSEREARILQEVQCEQNISLISTLRQPGGRLVLVFPFMPMDLEMLMKTSSIRQEQARHITRDLFKAVSHVHSLNIIHRDVKPSNILLRSKNGPAYLADFGIAWSPSDAASEHAQRKITDVGTTSYRPPELLFGFAAYDTSLDLWAAGCTVAEMVRPNHRRIFDAGDLGSELALIRSIFTTLGTPDEELWPVNLPKRNNDTCSLLIRGTYSRSSHFRIGARCDSLNILQSLGKKSLTKPLVQQSTLSVDFFNTKVADE